MPPLSTDVLSTSTHSGPSHWPASKTGPVSLAQEAQAISPSPLAAVGKRHVTFASVVRGQHTIHINDYTEDEVAACWVTAEENAATKDDVRRAVQLVVSGQLEEDNDEFCRRGTEHRTPQGARRRSQRKHSSRSTVLREQEQQVAEDLRDPEFLAELYRELAQPAQEEASQRGDNDEWDAWMS